MQNKPFHLTRQRLAAWYTGVMALILVLCGFAIYQLIGHTLWLYLTQDMQELAYQLENRIESALERPGQLEPQAFMLMPGLCLSNKNCVLERDPQAARPAHSEVTSLYELMQNDYCIRFLNLSQQPVAILQFPQTKAICNNPILWQQGQDGQGHYYQLESYPLHTQTQTAWGTIQIARSLNGLDIYLFQIELLLTAVIIMAIMMAGACSWWLAGLAIQPIRQSYEQMEQFTADAAHELRTPLAALRAMVQTALRSENLSTDDAKKTLYIVNRQSSRLSKLVQDLLTLCQIGQVSSIQPTVCCLNTIIQEAIDEFAAIALSTEISLSVELPKYHQLQVKGDPEQLYRAIFNLLSNALQYTPAKGQVIVTLTSYSTQALIQVQDTGIGITPEEQVKIFNRFYRVDRERSRQRGGAGLGLAIVQTIVQSHQGTIHVCSKPGKGSVFTIRLPLVKKS
ncbi:two-component system sensor histidine kinase RppB [Pantanalinema rosaneae CENA516]|uniref:two-component system sensor histidine kinase RppB n=1 Tax=Pantanalinema rosaneae TaxID=1620701 RepID=UPI003D6E0498